MKFLFYFFSVALFAFCVSGLISHCQTDWHRTEINKLRRERDKAYALYRTANTRLSNFQDSINIHCICK